MKTIIERGASWCLEETRLLLSLWGEDLVLRQASNTKRTKECYERIAEKLIQSGFERTAEQVRTRVFNMIAEYRRILKEQNLEKQKKCVFFEPLHKIYQAKHMDDVKSALDDYEAEGFFSPNSNNASHEKEGEPASTSEGDPNNDSDISTAPTKNSTTSTITDSITNNHKSSETTFHNKSSLPSSNNNAHITCSNANGNNNSTTIINNDNNSKIGAEKESSSANSTSNEHNNIAGPTQSKKLKVDSPKPQARVTAAATNHPSTSSQATPSTSSTTAQATTNATVPSTSNSTSSSAAAQRHSLLLPRLPTSQLYQAPVNTFDVTSSALLIDRMFAHLAKESENMREWIALEKERLQLERVRRQQEADREIRRERIITETLMKLQDQWLAFLSKVDPRVNDAQLESNASQVESSQTTSETIQMGSGLSSASSSVKLVVVEPRAGNGSGGDSQIESK